MEKYNGIDTLWSISPNTESAWCNEYNKPQVQKDLVSNVDTEFILPDSEPEVWNWPEFLHKTQSWGNLFDTTDLSSPSIRI